MVRDAWSVAVAQKSQREHLLATEGASTSEGVSSPTGRSAGRFLFLELLEQQHLGEVLHAKHSKGSGSGST